jgi:hypothetical protein
MTDNRQVKACKLLIFRNPIVGFSRKKAKVRQSPWTTASWYARLWSNAALMPWTARLGAWYTVHMCSIFTQENGYGHALCRLCQSGSALSHRTARVAPSGDLDRVLPAMLPPPSHRLPLPGLRPGGGATSTTATTSPCTDNGLTGDEERTTPALSQMSLSRRPTRRVGASRGPTPARPRPSLSTSSESVSMAPTWFLRCVLPHTGVPCVPGRAGWTSLCVAPLRLARAAHCHDSRQCGGRSPACSVSWEEAMGGRQPRRSMRFQRVGRHEGQHTISCPRGVP